MQLEGDTAIVTGEPSGIGTAIATAYAEEGIIADRIESEGTAVDLGYEFVQTDGREYDEVEALVSRFPEFVETPMTEEALERERFYNYVRDDTPMNRLAQSEEIAPLAAFLASDGARYMTGANVPVDGGWTAH